VRKQPQGFWHPVVALQAAQGIGEPAADLLKQPLFLRRPRARGSALVQPEQIRLIPLAVPEPAQGR